MGMWGGGQAGGWSSGIGGDMHAARTQRTQGHWGSSFGRNTGGEEEYGALYNPALFRRLAAYLRPHKGHTLIALAAMILFAFASYLQPLLITLAVRDFISEGDLVGLRWLMIVFVMLALLAWGAEYVRQWAMAIVGHRILLRMRQEIFDHMVSLSQRFYDNAEVGRVMSRVTSDVQVLQELITTGVLTVIADVVGLGIVVVVLVLLDWQLALTTFTVLPILVLAMVLWSRRARVAFLEVRAAIAAVNGTLNEDLSGVRVVQSMGREEENARRFDRINGWNLRVTRRAGRLSSSVIPVVEVLTAVATAAVIVVAGIRLSNGSLDPATGVAAVIGFALYIQRFFDPVRDLVLQYTMFQRAMAGAERIFEVLDTQPEIQDAPDAVVLDDIRGVVTFDDVSLEYVPGIRVLHNIDLEIQPGETVALVGETGAGKTSIAALISRSYDVTEGAVRIDGHDVRQIRRTSLTQRMGVVLQDPFPVLRNRSRQHSLWAPRCDAWRRGGGGARRGSGQLDQPVARRVRYSGGRARADPFGGSAAVDRFRAGDCSGPAHPDPGRGHGERGFADGGADPASDPARDARAHVDRNRAPAEHDPRRQPDRRDGSRAHRGDRITRGTTRAGWHLRTAVSHDLRGADPDTVR